MELNVYSQYTWLIQSMYIYKTCTLQRACYSFHPSTCTCTHMHATRSSMYMYSHACYPFIHVHVLTCMLLVSSIYSGIWLVEVAPHPPISLYPNCLPITSLRHLKASRRPTSLLLLSQTFLWEMQVGLCMEHHVAPVWAHTSVCVQGYNTSTPQ